MAKISDLREKDIIETYFNRGPALPEKYHGIGDDCAVYRTGEQTDLWQLVSTDALIEDTHFKLDRIDPRDLGFKAVAVNFSDIAAMAGRPKGVFITIVLPGRLSTTWLQDFSDGIFELCEEYEVPVLGGDTTSSEDTVVISLTVIGEVKGESIRFRDGVEPGDAICVTGSLGDSAAGLLLELDEQLDKEGIDQKTARTLRERHYRPPITLEIGSWLGQHKEVHAMMDISDGLTSDLPYITSYKSLGANILREYIPISDELRDFSRATKYPAYLLAEDGGEDYQLLFTVDAEHVGQLQEAYEKNFNMSFYRIGTVTDEHKDLLIFQNDQRIRRNPAGFHHFAK